MLSAVKVIIKPQDRFKGNPEEYCFLQSNSKVICFFLVALGLTLVKAYQVKLGIIFLYFLKSSISIIYWLSLSDVKKPTSFLKNAVDKCCFPAFTWETW